MTAYVSQERRLIQLRGFLTAYIGQHGISPTREEMAAGIGLSRRSTVSVDRLLGVLESEGFVRFATTTGGKRPTRRSNRAVILAHRPCPHCGCDLNAPAARVA